MIRATIAAAVCCATFASPLAHAAWDADLRKDEMTDESIGFAAERGSAPGSFVAIQCQQGAEIVVLFTLPTRKGLKGRVTYRVDGEKAATIPGFTTKNGVGLLGPEAKELIPKLLKGSRLLAQGHQAGFGAQPTRVFQFGLSGSAKAFAEACSWHPDYESLNS